MKSAAQRVGRSRASRPQRVYLNGKWLSQALTGTQRYAAEISRRLVETHRNQVVLVIPADAVVPEWARGAAVKRARVRGAIFEQIALPWITRGQYLLNLSGSSPMFKRRQGIVLFDASVFRFPETFSKAFVLWYQMLYRTARYRARDLFTISEFSRAELSDVLKIAPDRLNLVYCGADHIDEMDIGRSSDGGTFAIAIGTLTRRKNLVGVIESIAPVMEMRIVGDPPESSVFANTTLPDSSEVRFLGRLSDDETAAQLQQAVALVFPSVYEGFGLPIVEAQRIGCPVVCARTSSLPEVAGDGALYFDWDNPEEARRLVEGLANDESLRQRLIARGRENAARFKWEDATKAVAEVVFAR